MGSQDLDNLRALQKHMNHLPAKRAKLIATCRTNGHTWTEIASAMNMSHPGAMKAATKTQA